MAIREFDFVVNGQRVGWWRELDPDLDDQPPSCGRKQQQTTRALRLRTLRTWVPMGATWHHRFPGGLPMLCFRQQLAVGREGGVRIDIGCATAFREVRFLRQLPM